MSSDAQPRGQMSRWILIAAAAIAALAVGYSVWRTQASKPEPVVAQAPAPAGDVGAMISGLEAKLKANPTDAEGWRMLGWAFFETGEFAESAQAYARATQLAPGKADYWSSLGEARVLAGSGVPADAKTAFEQAISIDPKDPRARYFLAVHKDIAGDHKGAIADWIGLLRETPAGAPWEADVRRTIARVAAKHKIDVSKEMAGLRPTPAGVDPAAGLPKGQESVMIRGMVDGLDAKLKANPENLQGWIMLMRSRMQLGERAKASAAYRSANAAFAGKAASLAQIEAAAEELDVRKAPEGL